MSHDCAQRINELLAQHNTRLMTVITFASGPQPERIVLATEKADPKVRRKPVLFFASHCPMCGIKLDAA